MSDNAFGPLSRRTALQSIAVGGTISLAGCAGSDDGNGGSGATDDGSDETGDGSDMDDGDDMDGEEMPADIPEELPTDPDEAAFVDLTGQDVVEIDTRQGDDGEPLFVFDAPFVRVDPGTTVRFTNTDGAPHTVTSTPSLAERDGGEVFEVDLDEEGETFEWTADEPGYQHYYCVPHSDHMWGSIAVVDEDGTVPDEADAMDDDTDDGESGDESEGRADIPEELPTDPDDAAFVDLTGQDVVEIETTQGGDGDPQFFFDPPFVRVDEGTTIRWSNGDGAFHTITSTPNLESRSGGGDVFDEQITAEGETFEWEADEPGRQGYYCSPHGGFMFGVIDVV